MKTTHLIVVAAIGCALPGETARAVPRGPDGLSKWPAIECASDEDITIRGRYIAAEAVAVTATGNCDVEIYGSYIEAGSIGILAAGNSDVELFDTYVEGGAAALDARGNSTITLAGSRIVGGTVTSGNGDIEDLGGNEVSGASRRAASKVTVGPGGVRVESGGETVAIAGDDLGIDIEQLLIELGATVEAGQMRLQMAGDVLFDLDSAAIRPDAAAELAKVAHVIRQRAVGEVEVTGHTDSLGDQSHNLDLSLRRARAVVRHLERREGIPAHRMVASGLGESRPVDYNTMPDGSDNPEGRARNRRVEIKFAASEPGAGGSIRVSGGAESVEIRTGELPAACSRICEAWPTLGELQQGCVTASLELKGYSVVGTAGCIDVRSTQHCRLCWRTVGVHEADCAAIARSCLGG